ncbi:GNAT family N-acetyltransferase [Paenarthrobacter sp. OM7]|uniref:GNAT family N-acetyltransferase n=1 Tax=Paenarthrobacter sp. OM7 TaxID=3041264 RepID=UPI002468E9FC|nr:GNAT family N-acetyltransferase [Paenarthrobacter sp. OM7]WGM19819.1 GNAT family N-acetyltransferase [Paenarthrobacter sp. OM7]
MVELRAFTDADIKAHNAGEDDETVRWLSGRAGTVDSTRQYFAMLAENASRGTGKRGFAIWLDDQLAGYIDFDPEIDDLPAAGDVNISYAVHPWARRRAVATTAVLLVCRYIADNDIGDRAIIRADPQNAASIGVAERCGFRYTADSAPITDRSPDGSPVVYLTYALDLRGKADAR